MKREVNIGKKAQFYLIAAAIIVVVLLGLFATTNYIRLKPKDIKFYDLSKEIGLESGYVIDYGIYDTGTRNVDNIVQDWLRKYVEYSNTVNEIGDWVFVYGDENKMYVLRFTEQSAGNIYIDFGNTQGGLIIIGTLEERESFTPEPGHPIKVTTPDGNEYEFTLNPGENFYFVISKEEVVVIPRLSGEE